MASRTIFTILAICVVASTAMVVEKPTTQKPVENSVQTELKSQLEVRMNPIDNSQESPQQLMNELFGQQPQFNIPKNVPVPLAMQMNNQQGLPGHNVLGLELETTTETPLFGSLSMLLPKRLCPNALSPQQPPCQACSTNEDCGLNRSCCQRLRPLFAMPRCCV